MSPAVCLLRARSSSRTTEPERGGDPLPVGRSCPLGHAARAVWRAGCVFSSSWGSLRASGRETLSDCLAAAAQRDVVGANRFTRACSRQHPFDLLRNPRGAERLCDHSVGLRFHRGAHVRFCRHDCDHQNDHIATARTNLRQHVEAGQPRHIDVETDDLRRFETNSLDLREKHQELLRVNSLLEERVRERTAELAEAVARAQRASAAKDEFLARMSHEIRTPMNGVLGMLEALQSTPLNQVQLDYLRTAYGSAEILLTLINDILDYSKIEAGRLSVEKIDFDLPAMLQSIVRLWRKRAGDKGVNLNLTIDPACPGWVIGDPTRIGQILTNLVSNALKFTERGDVAVVVDVLSSEAHRGRLRFTVRDTGVGMNPSLIDRLFTAFAQADGTTSRRYGGTGLGPDACQLNAMQ